MAGGAGGGAGRGEDKRIIHKIDWSWFYNSYLIKCFLGFHHQIILLLHFSQVIMLKRFKKEKCLRASKKYRFKSKWIKMEHSASTGVSN